MKRLPIFLSFMAMMSLAIPAYTSPLSVSFAYDSAGNRIKREIVLSQRNIPGHSGSGTTYAKELLADREIRIHPNPTKGMLMVEIMNHTHEDSGQLSLFNMSGMQILSADISQNITTLDISACANGVYVLRIGLNGRFSSWKIIKE